MQCFFIAYVARSSPFGGHNGITGNTVLYSNLKFTNKQKDMKHTFSCSNCEMPFSIFLTDETTRTSTSEFEDVDTESHNIKHEENCQNCKHVNTIVQMRIR